MKSKHSLYDIICMIFHDESFILKSKLSSVSFEDQSVKFTFKMCKKTFTHQYLKKKYILNYTHALL